ncbi:unnamed protein product [Caenorhabditis nigoni]
MGVKQDYMGKTVPEIIAELEEFDRNSGQYWKTRIVEVLAQEVAETKKRYHKMNQYQQTYSYKLIREYGQILAAPVRVTNYKDMSYEELIERYKFRKEDAKKRKSMGYEFPFERTPTDFKKTFIKMCNKMSNRVKATVTGTLESMKKELERRAIFDLNYLISCSKSTLSIMATKEYHIGKTVPEMIAVLEEHEEYSRQMMKRFRFARIWNTMVEIHDKYDEMDVDQEIVKYETIRFFVEHLLNPEPVAHFETMPHEELIKRYNHRKEVEESWEAYYAKKEADSKKASAKKTLDWKPFQDMGNRVKTAVNGLFESMKKRIGKKNKDS